MEMIAKEAKVAVGTLYLHFSSRDAVYLNLAVESGERLIERFREAKARGLDTLEELRALMREYIAHFRDARYSFLLSSANIAQIRKRLRRASDIRKFERMTELRREIFGTVQTTMREACEAGLIADPFGPTIGTALLWSSVKGALELAGDGQFWRELTGLDPEVFVEKIPEALIISSGTRASAPRSGGSPIRSNPQDHSQDEIGTDARTV